MPSAWLTFDRELQERDGDSADSWYASSLRFAGQLATELEGHDFARLLELIPSRSAKWQEHVAEVLGLVRDPRSIPLLLELEKGAATASFAATQALRGFDRALFTPADQARIFAPAATPAPRHRLHQLVIADFLSSTKKPPGPR